MLVQECVWNLTVKDDYEKIFFSTDFGVPRGM